jgi:hypothetical protein
MAAVVAARAAKSQGGLASVTVVALRVVAVRGCADRRAIRKRGGAAEDRSIRGTHDSSCIGEHGQIDIAFDTGTGRGKIVKLDAGVLMSKVPMKREQVYSTGTRDCANVSARKPSPSVGAGSRVLPNKLV